jgi:hypothetical protein
MRLVTIACENTGDVYNSDCGRAYVPAGAPRRIPMRPRILNHSSRIARIAVLASLVGGCDGCPGKPYTPYTLTDQPILLLDGGPIAALDEGEDAAAPDAPTESLFTPIPAMAAPGDGKTWTIDPGVEVAAPAGRTLALGILLDADGDGKRDLIAWAQAPDGLRGELLFAPGAKPKEARTVVALPADVSARGCTARSSLAQVGPRTIAFDFAPQCAGLAKAPASRWVAVARFAGAPGSANKASDLSPRGPELALEIRAGALPAGEEITVAIDARDRDGDGRDDIAAKLSLAGTLRPFSGAVGPYPSVPTVSGLVAFFDRPAGLSRDPSEPETSLEAAAKVLGAAAKKKDTAKTVAASAHQLRRLRSLVCEESGRSAVTTSAGPIRCGDARSIEEISLAEATAAFALGDPARALVAISRLDAVPSLSDARKRDALKLLGKGAPFAKAQLLHRATAAPSTSASPGYGPLTFDAGGDLLIRTASGVVRVDRTSFAETPATMAAWPEKLSTDPSRDPSAPGAQAGGWALARVEQRCDSPVLLAVFEDTSGRADPSLARAEAALPILGPVTARGLPSLGRCTSISSVPITPLGVVPELGLVIGVGPELVGVKKQGDATVVSLVKLPLPAPIDPGAVSAGAGRSPDGATITVPTSRGLLVAPAGSSARLWTGQEVEQASSCTPSSGGARVACVGGGAALIYEVR